MRLYSFNITNFKSIIDSGECKISPEDNLIILAGQNESGKTSILEALDFFANGPSKNFAKLHQRQRLIPTVECKFLLDKIDFTKLPESITDDRVKKYFTKHSEVSLIRGNTETGSHDVIYLAQKTKDDLVNFLEQNKSTKNSPESDDPTPNLIDLIEKWLVSNIKSFILYESFDHLLPGEMTIAEIEKYPAVRDFEKVFKVNFADLAIKDGREIRREELRINTESSDDLNTYWKQKLEDGGKYNFECKISTREPIETTRIEFMINRNDGEPLYLEQKSQGFRWFSSFNLKLRSHGANKEQLNQLIILIDEPGQGLHEKAQLDVKTVLDELASQGAQIIYSTHCANLIGGENGIEFSRIRVITNNKEEGTKARNISQYIHKNGNKDAITPIRTALGLNTINPVLDGNKRNVIVEGITDHFYFEAFKNLLDKNPDYCFIPTVGVNNVPTLISIMIGWGINYKAVFDKDPNQGQKAFRDIKKHFFKSQEDQIENFVMQPDGCLGIEDLFTQGDFVKHLVDRELTEEESGKRNSEVAKSSGNKELMARLFLDKTPDISVDDLEPQTISNFTAVFDWLDAKFNSQEQNGN